MRQRTLTARKRGREPNRRSTGATTRTVTRHTTIGAVTVRTTLVTERIETRDELLALGTQGIARCEQRRHRLGGRANKLLGNDRTMRVGRRTRKLIADGIRLQRNRCRRRAGNSGRHGRGEHRRIAGLELVAGQRTGVQRTDVMDKTLCPARHRARTRRSHVGHGERVASEIALRAECNNRFLHVGRQTMAIRPGKMSGIKMDGTGGGVLARERPDVKPLDAGITLRSAVSGILLFNREASIGMTRRRVASVGARSPPALKIVKRDLVHDAPDKLLVALGAEHVDHRTVRHLVLRNMHPLRRRPQLLLAVENNIARRRILRRRRPVASRNRQCAGWNLVGGIGVGIRVKRGLIGAARHRFGVAVVNDEASANTAACNAGRREERRKTLKERTIELLKRRHASSGTTPGKGPIDPDDTPKWRCDGRRTSNMAKCGEGNATMEANMPRREEQGPGWAARLATLLGAAHIGCRASRRSTSEDDRAGTANDGAQPESTPSASGPVRLSELGQAIGREIGARAIAEAIAPALDERAAGLHPYELQELCRRHMLEDYAPNDDTKRKILDSAYERGVTHEQVLDVIAIELRNTLLERDEHARRLDEATDAFNAWRWGTTQGSGTQE